MHSIDLPDQTDPGHLPRFGGWLAVVSDLVWPAQAAVLARVFDLLLSGRTDLWISGFGALFVGLGLLRSLVGLVSQKRLAEAARSQVSARRSALLFGESATVETSDLGGPGAIAALVADKQDALRPWLLRYRPARLRVMVLPTLILLISAWYSWAVALVLLMAGPLIPVFMALVGWAAKDASARQMQGIGGLSDLLADRLAAVSDLRLIGASGAAIKAFEAASDSLRDRTMSVLRIAFLSSTVLELFSALGVAMVAVWVGFSLLGEIAWGTWGAPLSPFAGVFLLLLAPDFFQPLRDLAAAWHDKAAADAVMDETNAWRQQTRAPLSGAGAGSTPWPFTGVATRDLAARKLVYPDIMVRPGDGIALTGPSGTGKTTLLRLLAGLEQPTSGVVKLGDVPLDAETADRWRASVGWMPQAPAFLGRSLRFNVAFGGTLSDELVLGCGLGDVIRTLPNGDLTVLGEKGAGLSGGEARRVMLARALYGCPPVLLTDEPTADLDDATAQTVINALVAYVAQGGTLVAATHDPRLIAHLPQRVDLGTSQ